MKVSDIIAQAQVQADESYSDPIWIMFINRALDDLTGVAKNIATEEIRTIAIANGAGTIPLISEANELKTAHEILNVYYAGVAGQKTIKKTQLRKLHLNDTYSKGWKRDAVNLYVQGLEADMTTATITVDYYKKLSHAAKVDDDLAALGLPEQYHDLVLAFVCARSQQAEEELNDKNDFYAEYLAGKRLFAIDRTWDAEPENRKFIRKAKVLGRIGLGGEQ